MASLWWDGLKLREVMAAPMECVAVINAWSPLTVSWLMVPSSPPVYSTFLWRAMWLNRPDGGIISGLHISAHKCHPETAHQLLYPVPRISRRWFLRACTGCTLGPMLRSVEAQISNSPNVSWQTTTRMLHIKPHPCPCRKNYELPYKTTGTQKCNFMYCILFKEFLALLP